MYHPDPYYWALGSFSMQCGLPLGSPGTIPRNQKFSSNCCGMIRTINWPRNSVYHHDEVWRMGTEVQKQIHFTEKQELVVSGKNKCLYISGERKIDYSIGMVTSKPPARTFKPIWSMAIHLSLIVNDNSTRFREHTSESQLQWQSHKSKVNQAAADALQWTHFSESINNSLTQMALRPRSTTHASVIKATPKHDHTSQKDQKSTLLINFCLSYFAFCFIYQIIVESFGRGKPWLFLTSFKCNREQK